MDSRPPKVRLIKKALALFAGALMSLSLCACQSSEGPGEQSGDKPADKPPLTFTLPYRPSESFNPFTVTDRLNYDMLALVHDGLVSVGQDFVAHPKVASAFSADGNTIVFTLRDDVRFHDGSKLTAEDVEYSFEQARKSSRFALTFEKVRAFGANPDGTFTVELKQPYERAVALFTFPVVKKGSAENGAVPVGCGRYRLVKDGGHHRLEANADYYGGEMGISSIALVEILDTSTLYTALSSGLIHAVYSDMTKIGISVKGNVELRDFPENRLVFLGLNASKEYFRDENVKKAISFAIDREYIADTVMLGYALPTNRPFNPAWAEEGADDGDMGRSPEEAAELLDRAGFKADTLGRRSYNGKSIELVIAVNSENRLRVQMAQAIEHFLENVGLSAEVRAMKQDDYQKALSKRDYDIYIGEVKLQNDMDITPLISSGVNFTGKKSAVLEAAVRSFNVGEMDISELTQIFGSEMPILPVFFKKGTLIITRRVEGNPNPTQEDIFGGIETCKPN